MIKLTAAALCAALFGAAAADAATMRYAATLNSANSTTGSTSTATGNASLVTDSSDETLDLSLVVNGISIADFFQPLDSGPLGPLHIHFGAPGETGPIVVPFPRPFMLAMGGYSDTAGGFAVNVTGYAFADAVGLAIADPTMRPTFDQFVANLDDQLYYVNIHTTANPAGEIRGNLAPIPLPAGGVLLVGALGALAALRRRRRAA